MMDGEETVDVTPQGAPRLRRTIVLVGLMGAGKTSVGRRLATLLRAPFVDSDTEIVQAAHMTIPEIFETYGEADFRDGERRVIMRLLEGPPSVLATGGGAFIQPATREAIQGRGASVWLSADVNTLWERVRDRPGRPLLEADDPKKVLAALHAERGPIYALADVTVESRRGASHETMAREILRAVQTHDQEKGARHAALKARGT